MAYDEVMGSVKVPPTTDEAESTPIADNALQMEHIEKTASNGLR